MQPKHYFILAGFLAALGAQLSGLEHGWQDALSPTFIGAVLTQLSLLITAMYTDKPAPPQGR